MPTDSAVGSGEHSGEMEADEESMRGLEETGGQVSRTATQASWGGYSSEEWREWNAWHQQPWEPNVQASGNTSGAWTHAGSTSDPWQSQRQEILGSRDFNVDNMTEQVTQWRRTRTCW